MVPPVQRAVSIGLISGAVAVWSGVPNVAARQAQAGLLRSEYVYETASFPSSHASTIAETPDGLVTAFFGGTAERNPDVGIWVSRRENGRWTAPVEVANGVQSPALRHPTWNPVLFHTDTNTLSLFYKVGPSPSTWWGMVKTSTDNGRTWSAARRLPDGIVGPVKNKPVRLANGDLLSGSSTEHDGWRVHFERSSDNGRTWIATPPINDGRTIGAIQPSILVHPGNRLQAIGRTRAGKLFETWSTDQGRTWSPLALLPLPNSSAGTDAITLRDGRHLLVYNHSPDGRSPLNVAVSTDGRAWQAALVLEDTPGQGFAYPAVIQSADGLVHVTYTWKRERIKYAAIDPAALVLRPIVDGQWPK
jgi:predicted neuraminidase